MILGDEDKKTKHSMPSLILGRPKFTTPSHSGLASPPMMALAAAYLATFCPCSPVTPPAKVSDPAIAFLTDPASQWRRFDFIQRMNRRLLVLNETDVGMEGIIHSMETAFRMQTATPDMVDISKKTEATNKLYSIGEKTADKTFAPACWPVV